MERWLRIHPHLTLDFKAIDQIISDYFMRSERLTAFGRKYKTRLKRHGKDTLYFQADSFTFIVQNSTLLTVEISLAAKRYLNVNKAINVPCHNRDYSLNPKEARIGFSSKRCLAQDPVNKDSHISMQSNPAVKIHVPDFRLTGIVLFEDGNKKNIRLGTHEAISSQAQPERFVAKPQFQQLIREKFMERCPQGELIGVFISLGKKQESTLFCSIHDFVPQPQRA
jgi:hypothetical protein